MLVVATTEWFTQTFVVEYIVPDPAVAGVASVAVVASVVTVKRVGVDPQTAKTLIRRRRRRRCRRVAGRRRRLRSRLHRHRGV
ncbi:hypothetical protein FWK35_00030105 [Aphis craccivora]|uniref:Uncharacterized protein n=1 Tax=Aphis craccivora TaxID=307492 RepID=A0A6G0Y7M1_APHCR|nr:hypothetical protein FWK35_00030105 [Aphis craccivora]